VDSPELVAGGIIAAAVVGVGLLAWPWSRRRGRFALAAFATLVAWLCWHAVLRLSNGENFDVDNPALLGLSTEDVGSGVLAFAFSALPLGLWLDREQPARYVIGAAAVTAALTVIVDRFV
jgi:hypothetical protein